MDTRMKSLICITISKININSTKNNFEVLGQVSAGNVDVFTVNKTKNGESF